MPPRSKSTGGKGAKPPPQPAPTFDARTRLDQLTDIYHALDSDGTGKVAWLKLRPTLARGGLSSTEITKFKQSMAEQGGRPRVDGSIGRRLQHNGLQLKLYLLVELM